MFTAVLWGANEHFDEVVVQAIEYLALKGPLELWVVEIARMQFEVVGVDRRFGETGTDDYFDRFSFSASIELGQRMLVETKLLLNAREAVEGHLAIVAEALLVPQRFDGIEARGLDGGQHAANQAD